MIGFSRRFLMGSAAANMLLLPIGVGVHGRSLKHIPRIAFVIGKMFPTLTAAFFSELARLGYENGRNIIVDTGESPPPAKASVDLVVAASLAIALEVRRVLPTMPMVVATTPGFVSNGFARSLAHPGGNITGIDELPPGVTGRRLALLKEAASSLSRVALLSTTPGKGGYEAQLADAQNQAVKLNLEVKPYRASNLVELESALSAIEGDEMQGLLNFQGGLSLVNRQMIVDFASKKRIPAIYQSRMFAESGGLMAYAPDQDHQFRTAARYVDRILRGTRPGDLPIQYPFPYYLTINTSAAQKLNLQIPAALLRRAQKIGN